MSFIIECPQCKKKVEAQDEWDGLEASCPYCKEKVLIRKPDDKNKPEQIQPPVSQKAEEKTGLCHASVCRNYGNAENIDGAGRSPVDADAFKVTVGAFPGILWVLKEGEKYCENCGKIIKKNAKICRYCQKQQSDVVEKNAKYGVIECSECGESLRIHIQYYGAENTVYCPYCGRKISIKNAKFDSPHPEEFKEAGYTLTVHTLGNNPKSVIQEISSYRNISYEEAKKLTKNLPLTVPCESISFEEFKSLREKLTHAGAFKEPSNDDLDTAGCFIAIVAAIIGVLLYFLWYYPRTVFWISAPVVLITACILYGFKNKFVVHFISNILLLALIGWGIWAHTTLVGNLICVEYKCSDPSLSGDIYLIQYNDSLLKIFKGWKDQNTPIEDLKRIQAEKPESLMKTLGQTQEQFWKTFNETAKIQQTVFNQTEVNFRKIPNGNYMIIAKSEGASKKCTWLMKVIKKSSSVTVPLEDSNCIEETLDKIQKSK